MTPFRFVRNPGSWWFRIFGYGLSCCDRRLFPMVFSERMGLTRTTRLGRYYFKLLRASDVDRMRGKTR